jgi:hypothetical protein
VYWIKKKIISQFKKDYDELKQYITTSVTKNIGDNNYGELEEDMILIDLEYSECNLLNQLYNNCDIKIHRYEDYSIFAFGYEFIFSFIDDEINMEIYYIVVMQSDDNNIRIHCVYENTLSDLKLYKRECFVGYQDIW